MAWLRARAFGATRTSTFVLILVLTALSALSQSFDVDSYTSSLKIRVGPGTESYAPDVCEYLSTPQPLDANVGVLAWNCTAGTFCLAPTHQASCPPGFYCPENTVQPQYCCAGWFCPAPNGILRCPKGFYCPLGTVVPLPCSFFADCSEGTKSISRYGIVIFFVISFAAVFLVFTLKQTFDEKSYARFRDKLDHNASSSTLWQASPDDHLRDLGLVNVPFHVEFHNLGVVLPSGVRVLNGVSGELRPSRTCAIIGPSGCGKTTLLNALAGKINRTDGQVFVNKTRVELVKFRKLTGFVPQEDVMLRELTVRDVVTHSALMRLPRDMPHDDKRRVVIDTISFLRLSSIVDTPIGDTEHRGISGGQRKRVNIALELAMKPSILMADEPTSGLDSVSALELCQMLHRAAREQNLTVVAVIHAPSQETFMQFDDVIVLGKGGSAIYTGPVEELVPYFSRLGFQPTARNENPADFCLAVVKGRVPSTAGLVAQDLPICWARRLRGDIPIPEGGDLNAMRELESMLMHMVTKSKMTQREQELAATPPDHHSLRTGVSRFGKTLAFTVERCGRSVKTVSLETIEYLSGLIHEMVVWLVHMLLFWRRDPVRTTASEFRQFQLCFKRACLQIFRSRRQFLFDQLLHLGCGVAVGLVARDFDYLGRLPEDVCSVTPIILRGACIDPLDRIGEVGVFISLGVYFAGISVGATSFGHERVVYWREAASGTDSFPYFTARVIADLIRCVIAALFFSLAFAVFFPHRSSYAVVLLIVALLYFVAFAIGYFISMLVNADSVSFVGTAFALAWAVVFSGVVPDLEEIKTMTEFADVRWLWSISAPRYAIEALFIKEIEARPFQETKQDPLPHSYAMENFTNSILNMVLIGVCWNVAAFLAMKLTYRGKQM